MVSWLRAMVRRAAGLRRGQRNVRRPRVPRQAVVSPVSGGCQRAVARAAKGLADGAADGIGHPRPDTIVQATQVV